jgi:hypothetical protein
MNDGLARNAWGAEHGRRPPVSNRGGKILPWSWGCGDIRVGMVRARKGRLKGRADQAAGSGQWSVYLLAGSLLFPVD